MDEKQRRLIAYFNQLRDPLPPARISEADSLEETVQPPPAIPPKPSVESVRRMLEQQRDQRLPTIEETLAPSSFEGFAPPSTAVPITDRIVELGVSATEKALNEQELDPDELPVFEAIVLPGKRPVIDISNGTFSAPPPGWEFLAEYRSLIDSFLPAIGRIDLPELLTAPYAGTGFFVGEGILMTNRHVARLFVDGVGAGSRYLRFIADRTPQLHGKYEVGDPPDASGNQYRIVETLLVHPHWDVALLRVQPVGDAPLPQGLKLASTQPPFLGGGATPNVVVIGYPMLDGRSDIAEQQTIFRQIFGRKRLMPGYLTGFSDQQTRWGARLHAATHDASTLGGNSGSAVVDLTSGLVLALHFGGRYLVANYGVPSWELARDNHVVEAGVRFAPLPGQTAVGLPADNMGTETPGWLQSWDSLTPLVADEAAQPAPVVTPTPTPDVAPAPVSPPNGHDPVSGDVALLPLAPDWFERVSHTDLLEALRRDPERTVRLIRATLYQEEADDLLADLRRGLDQPAAESREEGLFNYLLGTGAVDPSLPEIVYLHGFTGGHLTAHGSLGGRVWLSPLAFVAGGVGQRLALAPEGDRDQQANQLLYPDGHIRLVYEKAARKWRLWGFVVHEFDYDWRKPIANAADRLHHFIEALHLERPGKKLALVAHSMGGLVAALYATRHPEWSSRVVQAIFLGSPLRGSYVPVEGLLGTAPLLSQLAQADSRDTLDDYIAALRSQPGLIDMLPDPELFPDAEPLYQRASWPKRSAPAQIWLDQSRQLKRLIITSPLLEGVRLIVSPDHPTIGDVRLSDGQLRAGPRTYRGDGTVLTRSAAASIAGLTVYRAQSQHSDLPREPAVIEAVAGLLREGRCDLPQLAWQAIQDATPLVTSPTETLEGAAAADVTPHLQEGIFTQRDADYFLQAE